ncbi:ribonuclease E/G [Enterovirga sp.]|uniref:Rne/Rng family ribonuclease n=1 Tax=Enterovirga sp. TaxID=2026350 RepID=UPI002638CCEE|nr:ribonuclease E/G [Enterovirga sp.]MDB5592871.1 ribonuclease [Enterovirga sp.]
MANKMLIDASHPEETRVVVTRGNKIEEFDFESASRRQLRGNIYLAKVTRVEPSLQAAFIEYGGNRHGFLAFSEIHPDYYQIPVADRQALIEDEARQDREDEEREERRTRGGSGSGSGRRRRGSQRRNRQDGATVSAPVENGHGEGEESTAQRAFGGEDGELAADSAGHDRSMDDEADGHAAQTGEQEASAAPQLPLPAADDRDDSAPAEGHEPEMSDAGEPAAEGRFETQEPVEARAESEPQDEQPSDGEHDDEDEDEHDEDDEEHDGEHDEDELEEHEVVEAVGGADALEEVPERRRTPRRHYKIQEVIKRRQVLLVQVVKEERGNKGAALTTYLSLAGRYAVLMPNTGKGGGISRKITSAEDRKRLKEIVQDLEVPDGMGIILRTAGASRTKPEIKRDFEYLMRLWESVRELTLESSAPTLVYEEGSLIKRAIRDLYNKDIDDVVVAGEEGYREAKDFMRLIMPAQTKAVRFYQEPQGLFAQHGVEAQLDAMFSNHVTLKSGGYLVINPTEALVSIDVNSGRATREHNIEDTAVKTNLEASEEIARQLRLRDLAGLIVIDFIDMEERRNDRAVEKKLKDCLKNDRARIQVGRISPFGLLEMSRQRIRTGVLESSSVVCRHCAGTGFVRSVPSVALQVLRSVEETLLRSSSHNLTVRTRTEVAIYILNQKRPHLTEIESRFGAAVAVTLDDSLSGTITFAIDKGSPVAASIRPAPSTGVRVDSITPVDEPIEIEPTAEYEREEEERFEERTEERAGPSAEPVGDDGGRRKRRRRRRRGRGPAEGAVNGEGAHLDESDDEEDEADDRLANASPASSDDSGEFDGRRGEPVRSVREEEPAPAASEADSRPSHADTVIDLGPEATHSPAQPVGEAPPPPPPEPEPEPVAVVLTPPDPNRPKRGGWWSKAKSALSGS